MATPTVNQQQQTQQNGNFNDATRQSWMLGQPIPYAANSTQPQQLPQIGFLSKIWLPISITFTTSNGTDDAFANFVNDNPTPWNIVQKVRVYTNEGQELFNVSGYGAYLHERTTRTALDPKNPIASFNSLNTAAAIYNVPATYAKNTTYTIKFYLCLDIAWDAALLAGLIFLQNPTNRVSLELSWGDIANNLLNITAGSINVTSVTCVPLLEVFNLPQNQANWPSINFAHMVIEDSNNPIVGNGDFVYKPLLGNRYLSIIQAFNNNGAPMVPGDFSSFRIQYQGTQVSYVENPVHQVIIQRQRYSQDLPDGVFVADFRMGTGMPELGNGRDIINTASLTDFQLISTIGASITQPAYMRGVREQLAELRSANGQ